jgi:hypothetical protein
MAEPYGFRSDEHNSLAPEHRKPMSLEELMKRIYYMTDIVFPAIHAKSMAYLELEKARIDNSHCRISSYNPRISLNLCLHVIICTHIITQTISTITILDSCHT